MGAGFRPSRLRTGHFSSGHAALHTPKAPSTCVSAIRLLKVMRFRLSASQSMTGLRNPRDKSNCVLPRSTKQTYIISESPHSSVKKWLWTPGRHVSSVNGAVTITRHIYHEQVDKLHNNKEGIATSQLTDLCAPENISSTGKKKEKSYFFLETRINKRYICTKTMNETTEADLSP